MTDGIESAVRQAKAAAGDKDVTVVGGAETIAQLLRAGLLDELEVGIRPVLLSGGLRLFEQIAAEPIEMEITKVIQLPWVTVIRYATDKKRRNS